MLFLVKSANSQPVNPPIAGIDYVTKSELSFGLFSHTRGLIGFNINNAKHVTRDRFTLIDFGLYALKHPKEVKMSISSGSDTRRFVYGRDNAIGVMHASYGARFYLAQPDDDQSLGIKVDISGGAVLAILKPVYYQVADPTLNNPNNQSSVRWRDAQASNKSIIGGSSYFKGIGESAFTYGGMIKSGLGVDWNAGGNNFYTLQGGVIAHAFPVPLPTFVSADGVSPNKQIYLNLFLSLTYGIRR